MKVYRIKDWNTHFENNKSREREKCSFCCLPNKQDGLGYGMLMREENGEALYGAFVAIVLICSKQTCGKRVGGTWHSSRDGWLTVDGLPTGCPLSARQLSVKSQFSEATISKMLAAVSSNEIGWIEAIEQTAPQVPAGCPPSTLEGKRREEKEGKERESAPLLKMSEKISLERELKSIGKELSTMGELRDHAKGSGSRARYEVLIARQSELRKKLGVVA